MLSFTLQCPKCGKTWQDIETLLKDAYKADMGFLIKIAKNRSEAILTFTHTTKKCNHQESWAISHTDYFNFGTLAPYKKASVSSYQLDHKKY